MRQEPPSPMDKQLQGLYDKSVNLLTGLVAIPRLSRQEDAAAAYIKSFLQQKGIHVAQAGLNIYALNKYADPVLPTILLNSHLDTVPPNKAYTRDPYKPAIEGDFLYGLGTTDAGASLVSLVATFLYFYDKKDINYNIMIAASAEEEISGKGGVELLFNQEDVKKWFQHPESFAIVGEPTQGELAIAEKGLMVLDCVAHGKPGHAARDEGENAIPKAMEAINWFQSYQFDRISPFLGPVKMTVTVINTENKSHNIIPSQCSFVVDIRLTEMYTHEELLAIIRQHVRVDITPRSMRLRSTLIPGDHPVVEAGSGWERRSMDLPHPPTKHCYPYLHLNVALALAGRAMRQMNLLRCQTSAMALNSISILLARWLLN